MAARIPAQSAFPARTKNPSPSPPPGVARDLCAPGLVGRLVVIFLPVRALSRGRLAMADQGRVAPPSAALPRAEAAPFIYPVHAIRVHDPGEWGCWRVQLQTGCVVRSHLRTALPPRDGTQ